VADCQTRICHGILLGGLLGTCGYFCAVLRSDVGAYAALILPITLILVVLSGTVLGSMLPLLFRRLGLDPALMSNPVVAGVLDVLGFLIYMNVATGANKLILEPESILAFPDHGD